MTSSNTHKSSNNDDSSLRESIRDKVVKVAKTVSPLHETPREDYTWEELQKIEKVRRTILTRCEDGFWKTLTYWKGTCLQILLFDSLLWMVLGIYAAIRVQSRLSVPTFVAEIGGQSDIAVIGGFLTFFLVFYVNQNHKRYFGLYNDAMACKGRIFDVATLSVAYLPKEVSMRLVRYMNAAHAAGYVGLSKTYPSHTFFDELNRELGLLTDDEYDRMRECNLDKGGACNRELIAWCMMEVHRMHRQGVLDHYLADQFRTQILGLRASIGKLYNAADLPIPFFYSHFICFLTVVYLPLFAITTAYNAGTGNDVYWAADGTCRWKLKIKEREKNPCVGFCRLPLFCFFLFCIFGRRFLLTYSLLVLCWVYIYFFLLSKYSRWWIDCIFTNHLREGSTCLGTQIVRSLG